MKKDIIHALLDGKQVQFGEIFGFKSGELKDWTNLDINNHVELYASLFTDDDGYKWRIKPETVELPTKLALMENGDGYFCAVAINEKEVIDLETNTKYFKQWLTDWITYEIEE